VQKASASGAVDHQLQRAPAWPRVPEEDALRTDSKPGVAREEAAEVGPDTLEQVLRERVRATSEAMVEEAREAALGAGRSARVGEARRGYRHGARARTLTTSLGPTPWTRPRARPLQGAGQTGEWHSRVLPRYQRRTARVAEASLGVYLSRTTRRRLKGALAPLLRGGP
jgi:hypothetical protein